MNFGSNIEEVTIQGKKLVVLGKVKKESKQVLDEVKNFFLHQVNSDKDIAKTIVKKNIDRAFVIWIFRQGGGDDFVCSLSIYANEMVGVAPNVRAKIEVFLKFNDRKYTIVQQEQEIKKEFTSAKRHLLHKLF